MSYSRGTLLFLAIGTVVCIAVLWWLGLPLEGTKTGNNLQRVCDPAAVRTIIDSWKNHNGRDVTAYAFAGVAFDTIAFIPFYSLLFFVGISRLPGPWKYLAVIGLIAGALDLAENLGILVEIAGNVTVAAATAAFSKAKWGAIFASIAIWVIGALLARFQRQTS
jgi:hypothetical protein